eukprot:1365607-Amphidinium_carterae.2
MAAQANLAASPSTVLHLTGLQDSLLNVQTACSITPPVDKELLAGRVTGGLVGLPSGLKEHR